MGLDCFSPPAGTDLQHFKPQFSPFFLFYTTQISLTWDLRVKDFFLGKSPSKLDFPPTTPNISSSASPLSSRTSSPSVKGLNQSTINEIKKIKFPLYDNYDWKLACRQCFVKLGEGIRGFRHHTNLTHECGKNILLVKLRKDGMNWIKVRPRPESKFQQFGSYKICTHFSNGNPCSVGEEKCTFAHNSAEKVLWNYDREESWLLMEFLAKLHQYKIGECAP